MLATILAGDPGNHEALRLMSTACVGVGDLPRAVDAARAAVAAAPQDPGSHLALWWACYSAARYPAAAAAAAEVVRLAPVDPAGHRALAVALSHLRGRRRDARRAAREAVRLAPDASDSWQSLGYALHRRRPAEARRAYERALALNPMDATSRQNLAALDVGSAPVRAIQGFAEALAMDPTLQVARSNLDRTVGRAALLVAFVWLMGANVAFREGVDLERVIAYSVLVVPFTVWSYVRLPRAVKQSLGSVLAPDVTKQVAGLVTIGVGASMVVTSLVLASVAEDPTPPLVEVVFVLGFVVLAAGSLAVSAILRHHRRERGQ